MLPNLDRYKKDLDSLITKGNNLLNSMQAECFPEQVERQVREALEEAGIAKKSLRKKTKEILGGFPDFRKTYQTWFSEAKAMVKQLLPDRLSDFVRHYEKPKPRKDITYANFTIEDYLQGLTVNRTVMGEKEKVVGPVCGHSTVPTATCHSRVGEGAIREFTFRHSSASASRPL